MDPRLDPRMDPRLDPRLDPRSDKEETRPSVGLASERSFFFQCNIRQSFRILQQTEDLIEELQNDANICKLASIPRLDPRFDLRRDPRDRMCPDLRDPRDRLR